MSWGDTDVVDDQTRAPSMTDGVVMLRPLATNDAPAWLAGEDEEQRRWFEAPRPSQLHDVQRFIAECQTSWRMMGSLRHWGIWSLEPDVLVGGVELRSLESDEVNLSYLVSRTAATRFRLASGTTGIGVCPHLTERPGRRHQDVGGKRSLAQPRSRPWGSLRRRCTV